jgi:hypothetical protein
MFRPAARTADPGKSTAGVAAIEVLFDHLFDDRTEKSVFPLKSALIFRDKPLEMMEQHPIEDGSLRMTRAIDSRHIGNEESRNAPSE